jgi:GNAT superfamily N-acetyltransferase
VSDEQIEVRPLREDEVDRFHATMPSWNGREYGERFRYQEWGLAVQLVAWNGDVAVGRGMVVFPGHPEWSESAYREGCPEIRDLSVAETWRRRGIGTTLIREIESICRGAGFTRLGLCVGLDDDYEAGRALYDRLAFAFAHGPFISAALLDNDDGSTLPVAGVCEYRVKML